MATSRAAIALQPSLLSRLEEARARTDSLFNLLPPNSFYDRPVPERHRLIFYLGHLEAFDQNLLSGPLGSEPQDAVFDKLFAFGIDPVEIRIQPLIRGGLIALRQRGHNRAVGHHDGVIAGGIGRGRNTERRH